MTVFVDASFLIALLHKKDDFHPKAKKVVTQIESNSIYSLTSNIATAEVVNFIFRTRGPKAARKCLRLVKKTGIKEIFVGREIFSEAYRLLFAQKSKRGLNLFDCLHLATMKSLGIGTILSFDRGFKNKVTLLPS